MKIIGLMLLFSGCCVVGFQFAQRLGDRVKVLKMYQEILIYIREEIRYAHMELDRIILNIKNRSGLYAVPAVKRMIESVACTGGFSQAWEKTLDDKEIGGVLEKEDLNVLRNFSLTLGQSDTEGQLAHCERYLSQLKRLENAAENERETKGKLYRTLGVIFGILLVIVFL